MRCAKKNRNAYAAVTRKGEGCERGDTQVFSEQVPTIEDALDVKRE